MSKVIRPKYKEEYCESLMAHMKRGLSFESFCGIVGCGRTLLYDWLKEYEEFADAKERGVELSRLFYEEAGVKGLFTVSITKRDGNKVITKSEAINSAIWIAQMRYRFHDWNEKLFKQKDEPSETGEIPQLNIIINGNKVS